MKYYRLWYRPRWSLLELDSRLSEDSLHSALIHCFRSNKIQTWHKLFFEGSRCSHERGFYFLFWVQCSRLAAAHQGRVQCRADCFIFVFSALLIWARLRSDNRVQHQLLRFWLLRKHWFQRTKDRLGDGPLLLQLHRGCDQQQRTQTQSHQTRNLLQ